MSFAVSMNWDLSHFRVWVVRWNFFGLKDANSLSAGVRNRALRGESGRKNHSTTPHAIVIRPNTRNRSFLSTLVSNPGVFAGWVSYLPFSKTAIVIQHAIRYHGPDNTSHRITCEPDWMPWDMFSRGVPHAGNQRETGTNRTFKYTQEGTQHHESSIVPRHSVEGKNDSPGDSAELAN